MGGVTHVSSKTLPPTPLPNNEAISKWAPKVKTNLAKGEQRYTFAQGKGLRNDLLFCFFCE